MHGAVTEVLEVLEDYFDGLYDGDTEKLGRVYHERVRLFCATDPDLLEMDLPSYLEAVKNRPSPASRQDPRHDRVVALEVPSPTTAHARVYCAYLPKVFTDDLTLVRSEGLWRIIAKVWHYDVTG
ncbi:MAG TPA: nuclear transport factor 2 family protein [Acidimicrobiia bacterium]|nr:nuclear transport factor 2 family protein [Acidimicrobiia bacterium]